MERRGDLTERLLVVVAVLALLGQSGLMVYGALERLGLV